MLNINKLILKIRDKYNNLKFMHKIQQFLRGTKIKNRLIVSFLLITLIPISLIGIYASVSAYINMTEKVKSYSLDVTEQIVNNISYIFDNYVDMFNQIALDDKLSHDLVDYENNVHKQVEIENRIWLTTTSVIGFDSGINTVEICTNDGHRFYYSAPVTKGTTSQSKLISEALKHNDLVWNVSKKETPDDSNIYIILSKKMTEKQTGKVIGVTLMAVNRDYIDTICQYNAEKSNSYVVLTDSEGTVISHSNTDKDTSFLDSEILHTINTMEKNKHDQNPKPSSNCFKAVTKNGVFMVSYDILPINNWRAINIIPYSYLMENTIKHVEVTASIALICIIFTIYFSTIITKSISSPIKTLLDSMHKVGKGDLDIKVIDECENAKDEYAMLIQGFNNMTSKLKSLVNDVYKSTLKKRDLEFHRKTAELNSLQKQINPHFLYNTLESIYWSAELKEDEEIGEMITALCKFFRANINKGLEYISIKQEIENTQNYIYLQKVRFGERISVSWQIDKTVLNYNTIKLILQPIVENSFVHGIENKESDGRINIKIQKEDDSIVFEVSDNGIGISPEVLDNLENCINDFDDVSKQFISVKNVNQRIKLYFGDKYGVKIGSQLGKGTTVRMKVPIIDAEDNPNNVS